jgi:hypothetical protein
MTDGGKLIVIFLIGLYVFFHLLDWICKENKDDTN